MNKFSVLLLIIVLLLLTACATSPTGRSQFLIMSGQQMSQMGIAAFSDMKKKSSVVSVRATNNYVNCVANAITSVITQSTQNSWEVVVFDDKSANAFALPGGKIGVNTGLLNVAKSQHQLAAVVGHEVGHVLARHGNERMSIDFASQTSQQLLGAMLENGSQKALLMGALGLGTQLGVQLPYSRVHESEADLIGLKLMADAGFNPQGSIQLWNNMAANSKQSAPPELLSTHPANDTRIKNLRANIPGVMANFYRAQKQGRQPNCKP